MFSHALRLVWNRRRANMLVIMEVGAAFVAVFVLVALVVHLWTNYQRPLGFDFEDVWQVTLRQNEVAGIAPPSAAATRADVIAALHALPAVEVVHEIEPTPFLHLYYGASYGADLQSTFETRFSTMSSGAPEVLGLRLVEGRWFGPQDEGQTYRAVLVNRRFVEAAFGDGASPLGRQINHAPEWMLELDSTGSLAQEARIVGVVEEYRPYGEFSDPEPFSIEQLDPEAPARPFRDLFLKVAPGTDAALEEAIIETVLDIASGWTAAVTPWAQLRAAMHAERLTPLGTGAVLGTLFLTMVALGLVGVLWQDVVRRTQELGVRRALGATSIDVRRQVVLEMVVVGLFGVVLGAAVALQFPLLELIEQIRWVSALPALVLSAMLMLSLVVVSALYPSWLASRREPADALRYE